MKSLIKIIFALLLTTGIVGQVSAQSTKSEKKAAKEAEIKDLVNSKNYVFTANYVYPLGGGQRYLTPYYDLTVAKDSVIAYLPYFGVAYSGAGYNNSDDNGIKFTSTDFEYRSDQKKNGSWLIFIKPKDSRTTNQVVLTVQLNGSANLSVISNNRQQISFDGYIKERSKKR